MQAELYSDTIVDKPIFDLKTREISTSIGYTSLDLYKMLSTLSRVAPSVKIALSSITLSGAFKTNVAG
jgi:hypothetical protein